MNNRNRLGCFVPGATLPKTNFGIILVLALVGAQPVMAQDQNATVEGTWAVAIEQPRTRCRWEGHVRLVQRGLKITGSGRAEPVGRSRRCPPLEGDIDGKVDGDSVRFGFATGRLGLVEFEGTLGDRARSLVGRWRGRAASGKWWASRAR